MTDSGRRIRRGDRGGQACAVPRRVGLLPGQAGDDLAPDRQRVLVIERLVVGDAADARMDARAAKLFGGHVLARRGLHQRRAAQEDRARAADDDRLVAHRRDVGAAGRARAHDQRDLRDARRRHPRLVVEDAAEVLAVGEDVVLERQERAAGVDQVDARQAVLERDLLSAQVLLDGHRVVRAALDRRVVGDDRRTSVPSTLADAGDDARAGRVVVVHADRRERGELQERRSGVDQLVDALADGQLAALAVARDRALVAGRAALRSGRCVRRAGRRRARALPRVGARLVARRIDARVEDRHAADDRETPGPVGPGGFRGGRSTSS